ncbi:unnamed protein product [Schistosoma curassoni]|nr:unnamed protein product [Schistosoma curassoni]
MIQTKSSWTPLVNKDANKTLFEERKHLILAWFAKWSESQRKELMTKLFELCTQKQLESLFHNIENKIPLYQIDFTRILPRVLCIYLFSFLDPRSLCRCAQVSWYWRYLTESNELWASKCLRYGWDLIASHSQWEPGIWKKHYIQNIRYLQFHISEKVNKKKETIETNPIIIEDSINKENGDTRERCSEELFNKRCHTLNFVNNHHQDHYENNNIDTTINTTATTTTNSSSTSSNHGDYDKKQDINRNCSVIVLGQQERSTHYHHHHHHHRKLMIFTVMVLMVMFIICLSMKQYRNQHVLIFQCSQVIIIQSHYLGNPHLHILLEHIILIQKNYNHYNIFKIQEN